MAWPWLNVAGEAVKSVFSLAKAPIDGWQERKTLKAQADVESIKVDNTIRLKQAEANVELAKQGIQAETAYDTKAQENMKFTWKDEYILIVLFFPVNVLFICPFVKKWLPSLQADIINSVNALEQFPAWYTWLLTGIVIATFGLRWYFNKRK